LVDIEWWQQKIDVQLNDELTQDWKKIGHVWRNMAGFAAVMPAASCDVSMRIEAGSMA
jgi:hypothetical protein